MLAQKYLESFLEIYDTVNNKGQVIKNIVETEKQSKVELFKWDEEHIIVFLKKFESISPISLRRNLTILQKFTNFICERESLEKRAYTLDDGAFMMLIDKDKLLSVTLSYEQFQNIRRQLGLAAHGETINYRDKLMFELAWYSLTEDELRMIKKEDVEFTKSKEGMDIAILPLITGRSVTIEDEEILEDIKQCMITDSITRIAKDKRLKKTRYKDSEYLIRPVTSGPISPNAFFGKPSTALKGTFVNQEITCEGIDCYALSLDDIRRSRLVLMLAPKNEKFFDFKEIARLYNLKTLSALKWRKELAGLKYPVKK